MKKIIVSVIVCIFNTVTFGQVTWNFSIKKIAEKKYELHLMATVDESWHIYSQSTPDGGPFPTKIIFNHNPLLTISGKPKEIGDVQEMFEETFGVEVKYYENKVDYVQTLTLRANAKTNISGTLEYMVCNDQQCIPPKKVQFNVKIQQ